MRRVGVLALVLAACLSAVAVAVLRPGIEPVTHAQTPAKEPSKASAPKPTMALPNTTAKAWTGDLDGMIKRRQVRILVLYSKTYYFVDRGIQRGLSYEVGQLLDGALNTKLKSGHVRVHIIYVPTTRDKMIPALLEGRGDIAMGNLTVTPERQKLVDFTAPTARNTSEVVVTGPGVASIGTVQDLAGKEVYIQKSTSFHESVVKLNAELAKAGKAPMKIRLAPESLQVEDILEMVNVGLVPMTIADDYVVAFWKQILTNLTVHPGAAVRTGGDIAWMIRKDSPQLKAELDGLIARNPEGSARRNELLQKYLKSTKYVKAAGAREELVKFERTVEFFRKYGDRYEVDYLLLMAQGYQESQLNQEARSRVGAVGIMQVMPATGKDMKVGDITQIEPNIHAGVKFLRAMMNEYYDKEPMDRLNKGLFSFAAYNAGPGRVGQLRKLAKERGLDPNVWFNNVELMAAEKIGRETVTYVSNIYKYYLAYQLIEEQRLEREKAREAVKQGGGGK